MKVGNKMCNLQQIHNLVLCDTSDFLNDFITNYLRNINARQKKNYEEIADICIPELIKDDEIMT